MTLPRSPNALWMGTGIHIAIAGWYAPLGLKRGIPPHETWNEWCGDEYRRMKVENETLDTDEFVNAKDLGEAMLLGYIEEYGMEEWRFTLGVEMPFQVTVTRPGKKRPYVIYAGTMDGAFRDLRDDRIWLDEHKTAKVPDTKHLTIDDQAGSYLWVGPEVMRAMGLLKKKERISGIHYNFLRKAMPDERPVNEDGLRTNKPKKEHYLAALTGVDLPARITIAELEAKARELGIAVVGDVSAIQPSPRYLRERIRRSDCARVVMAQRVLAEAKSMEKFRTGKEEVYKTPTKDCWWQCPFFDMCELHEDGGPDWMEFRDSVYVVTDPYEDHRGKEEEVA